MSIFFVYFLGFWVEIQRHSKPHVTAIKGHFRYATVIWFLDTFLPILVNRGFYLIPGEFLTQARCRAKQSAYHCHCLRRSQRTNQCSRFIHYSTIWVLARGSVTQRNNSDNPSHAFESFITFIKDHIIRKAVGWVSKGRRQSPGYWTPPNLLSARNKHVVKACTHTNL